MRRPGRTFARERSSHHGSRSQTGQKLGEKHKHTGDNSHRVASGPRNKTAARKNGESFSPVHCMREEMRPGLWQKHEPSQPNGMETRRDTLTVAESGQAAGALKGKGEKDGKSRAGARGRVQTHACQPRSALYAHDSHSQHQRENKRASSRQRRSSKTAVDVARTPSSLSEWGTPSPLVGAIRTQGHQMSFRPARRQARP